MKKTGFAGEPGGEFIILLLATQRDYGVKWLDPLQDFCGYKGEWISPISPILL